MRYQAALLPDYPPLTLIVVFANPWIGCARWWARQDSNLQPSRYERPALPLSYRPSPVCPEIDCTSARAKAARSGAREDQREGIAAADQVTARDPRQPAHQTERKSSLDVRAARRVEHVTVRYAA